MEMAIEVRAQNMRNRVLGTWQGQAHGDADRPHLELVIFGTSPEYQGRGLGASLLRFLGEVADADGVPTHLETAGSRNVGFYEEKGGFKAVHRLPVASLYHEGGGVAMERPANSATKGGGGSAGPKASENRKTATTFCEACSVNTAPSIETPSALAEQTTCPIMARSAHTGSDTRNGHDSLTDVFALDAEGWQRNKT